MNVKKRFVLFEETLLSLSIFVCHCRQFSPHCYSLIFLFVLDMNEWNSILLPTDFSSCACTLYRDLIYYAQVNTSKRIWCHSAFNILQQILFGGGRFVLWFGCHCFSITFWTFQLFTIMQCVYASIFGFQKLNFEASNEDFSNQRFSKQMAVLGPFRFKYSHYHLN